MKTCEICGTLLFNETDIRCARCLNAGKVRPSGTMPDRSPIMAKPDTRYAIPEERPEYDGIPDPELPYDFGRPGRRAFLRSGTYTRYNPSDAAYKVWLRAAFIWAGVTLVLTLLCAWRHHLLIAAIWTAVTALILGFAHRTAICRRSFCLRGFWRTAFPGLRSCCLPAAFRLF